MIERVVACLVDELLPGDDGTPPLPRGSEVGVDRAVRALIDAEEGSAYRKAVTAICAAAGDRHAFVRATPDARGAAISAAERTHPEEVRALIVAALEAYYQSSEVIVAMGWRPQSPQPLGHEVEPLDLSLLDPVTQRTALWREV